MPLDIRGKIAILSFDVTPLSPRAVVIDINGVRNKLSGSSAPYPNHNNRFNYVLSGGTDGFLIQKNANEYRIENLTLSFLDEKELYNSSGEVWEPQTHTSDAGRGQVFSGRITMKKNGYFATSDPYRKGYEIQVDGRAVSASEILKIDDTFLGLRLEEGMHEIEIRFVPPGYRTGLAISAISLLILLVLSAWQKTKHICENRVFRYLITGGMTTAVNYVIYFGLFIAAGRSVAGGTGGAADSAFSLAANSLAWLGAVIFAYFANRRFVFQSENSILHEFIQFALLRLVSLTVENILLYLLLTLMAMPERRRQNFGQRHHGDSELCGVQIQNFQCERGNQMKDKISIIVPCFNEEACIDEFYRKTQQVAEEMRMKEGADYELLFVDDGSCDGTLDCLRKISQADSRCRFISFSRNFGKEAAMYAGLNEAAGNFAQCLWTQIYSTRLRFFQRCMRQ